MQDNFAIYPSLKNMPVIITGGASGIGEQITRAFVSQGSKVGFVDFNEDDEWVPEDEVEEELKESERPSNR